MPNAATGPADLLARMDVLALLHDRGDVPIVEMADLQPPVEAGPGEVSAWLVDASRLDRVDAM